MANRYAVANGNWSSTSTWDGGTLPTSADDVYSNSYTVTVDQNVTVLSLQNVAASLIAEGGTFILTNGVIVTATGTGLVNSNGTLTLIEFNLNSPNAATINSTNMSGQGGAPGTQNAVIRLSGTATLTVNSNWSIPNTVISISADGIFNLNGSGGHVSEVTTQPGMRISATAATLNWVGNLTYVGTNTWAYISNNGNAITSTINMTGNLQGNPGSSNLFNPNGTGISTAGVLNITGTVSPASLAVNTAAIYGTSASTITINGIIRSNTARCYAVLTTGLIVISGQIICVNDGYPIIASRMQLDNNNVNTVLYQTTTSADKTLYEPGISLETPAKTDVRDGVTYASGSLTGTLKVPPSGSVAIGVPVDDGVGTAMISISDMGTLLTSFKVS